MSRRTPHDLYAPLWVGPDELPRNLYDEVLPGLYQGGTRDDAWVDSPAALDTFTDERPFDAVVTLFAWAQPFGWEVEELRYGFGDADLRRADTRRLVRTARWAYERWTAGDRVLIRCQAGMNRSGLVTALVLMLDGRSAADAIRLVRERRSPVVLFNRDFVDWLLTDARDALAEPEAPGRAGGGAATSRGFP